METKITLESPIVEISQSDSTTKEITMLVHKLDIPNGNGLDFKEEYTTLYMNSLVNKPVVTSYYPLEDDLGDHEPVFDENGRIIELRTIAIGTIKEVWIGDYTISPTETVKALFAKAVVWSYKYPQIVACVEKLFNAKQSTSSVEVEIYKYGENPTQQYRYSTDYTYLGNCLLGSKVAPADSDAGVINLFQKEVAMAAHMDLNALKGGEPVGNKQNDSAKELFNKGNPVKYVGDIQINELSYDDIRDQIYNIINPLNPQNDERDYNYWIRTLYQSRVILEDWNDSGILYSANYQITSNVVSLDSRDKWVQVEVTYQPVGTDVNQLLSQKEQELLELNNKNKEAQSDMEEKVAHPESQVKELSSKVEELEGTIVSQQETISGHVAKETELNTQIADLQTYKDKYETSQKEAKAKELSEKYSKVLNKEVFASERVQNAIKENNETELNSIVAEEVLKEVANKSTQRASEDVIVTASKQDDLIPQDIRSKLYNTRS